MKKEGAAKGEGGTFKKSHASIQRQFRHFVLMTFTQLRKDAARGEGEYLAALNKLLAELHAPIRPKDARGMIVENETHMELLSAFEAAIPQLRG